MTVPTQALAYHRRSAGLSALAARAVRHQTPAGAAAATVRYQRDAAALAIAFGQRVLAEQGADDAGVALEPATFTAVTEDLTGLYSGAPSTGSLSRLVGTLVADAGRSAMGVYTATRDEEYGTTRLLVGGSCSRCAVLAGRWYRWSDGFQRHPHCDCTNVPCARSSASLFTQSPSDMFDKGLIRGLSQAQEQAIRDGADISQIVNATSGMRMANFTGHHVTRSRRITQRTRLTPEAIYRLARDREEAIRLLRVYGYAK